MQTITEFLCKVHNIILYDMDTKQVDLMKSIEKQEVTTLCTHLCETKLHEGAIIAHDRGVYTKGIHTQRIYTSCY